MAMGEFWYSILEHGEGEDAYRLRVRGGFNLSNRFQAAIAAESAAEGYHNTHGSAESWPLTFVLYETEDGPEVARYEVERIMEPSFHAQQPEGGQ